MIDSMKEIVESIPEHIAIIMDGNGRWAEKRNFPRIAGHRAAVKPVKDVVRTCGELGVKYLTLYAFSTENWQRPKTEVKMLMNFLKETIRNEIDEINENNVRLLTIGRTGQLPSYVLKELRSAIEKTSANTGLNLILALSYGGRAEIIDAIKKLCKENTDPETLSEKLFSNYLYNPEIPDPDLLIRTSGEFRVSNFLLWQIAYTEIWVTKVLWPDFKKKHLLEAIGDYQKRERRFGRV